jgi:hypothetical protein
MSAESTGYVGLAAAALAASLWLGVAVAEAKAEHSHEGVYAVHFVTQHGSCRKAFKTNLGGRGGDIHATGHSLIRGPSRIGANGKVRVTLRFLHHNVHVTGMMRGHSGSGTWSLQGSDCRGSWRAVRQG